MCACPLYFRASSGVRIGLVLHYVTFFLWLLPLCYTEGFFLEPLLRVPALFWGIQWSAYLSGLRCATSFLPLYFGRLFGYHRIDPPFIRASVCRSFLSDIFLQALLSSRPGSWVSPEGSVSFAFTVGLFKDKVYPLLISSWHLFC